MNRYWIRAVQQCDRIDTKEGPIADKLDYLEKVNPVQGKKMRHLLSNPELEFRKLIDTEATEGKFAVHYVRVKNGSDFPAHTHSDVHALIYILEGQGHVMLDGKLHAVSAGAVMFLPPGTAHEIIADEPGKELVYLACVSPDIGQEGKADFNFLVEPK